MKSKDTILKDGRVIEALMGGMFKVELDGEEEPKEVLASLSGKMRRYRIRVMPGDRVRVEFSPYDKTRGRISRRYRQ